MYSTVALYVVHPPSNFESTRDLILASLYIEFEWLNKSVLACFEVDLNSIIICIEKSKAEMLLAQAAGRSFRFGNRLVGTFGIGQDCLTTTIMISYHLSLFPTVASIEAFVVSELSKSVQTMPSLKFAVNEQVSSQSKSLSSFFIFFETSHDASMVATVLEQSLRRLIRHSFGTSQVHTGVSPFSVEHLTVGKFSVFTAPWTSRVLDLPQNSFAARVSSAAESIVSDTTLHGSTSVVSVTEADAILAAEGSSITKKANEIIHRR